MTAGKVTNPRLEGGEMPRTGPSILCQINIPIAQCRIAHDGAQASFRNRTVKIQVSHVPEMWPVASSLHCLWIIESLEEADRSSFRRVAALFCGLRPNPVARTDEGDAMPAATFQGMSYRFRDRTDVAK